MMYQQICASPIGALLLEATDEALSSLSIVADVLQPVSTSNALLEEACRQLAEYFAGSRQTFTIPLQQKGSPFQQEVWRLLGNIPFGNPTSYQALSQQYGDPKAIRAIAAANGRNKIAILVPCHRVIGSNGDLTGFAWGIERKRWLLDHEARIAGREVQASLF